MIGVYFIATDEYGYIKIGMSGDVEKRIRDIQLMNPDRIIVKDIIEVDSMEDATALERELHVKHAQFRRHGEWFAIQMDTSSSEVVAGMQGEVDHLYGEERFVAHAPLIEALPCPFRGRTGCSRTRRRLCPSPSECSIFVASMKVMRNDMEDSKSRKEYAYKHL